jgi:tRNA-dihydrouridine synthase B
MKNFWQKSKKPILALAPMAGFTDSAFRQICRQFGADVVYSEMASASGLFYNPKKTLELLKFDKKEKPYVVQLFGSQPEHFAKAARIVTEKIKPDGIDINLGCPVKKVMKTGAGCALMLDYKLAQKIIKAVCENTAFPVSIKIRAGITGINLPKVKPSGISAVDFIQKIKDLPFSAVMIHCRTFEQVFSGSPDYSLAEKIKKIIPDKIVLANGGINPAADALKIIKDYPEVDGLGIARGALGQPWIFGEIKDLLKCHPARIPPWWKHSKNLIELGSSTGLRMTNSCCFNQIKKTLLNHLILTVKNKGAQGFKEFRVHIGWYIQGFPGASELRRKLILAKDIQEFKTLLKNSRMSA